jgi:hypothetical protein
VSVRSGSALWPSRTAADGEMRFQAKRKPVRVKKTRQIENLQPPFFVFIQQLLFLFAEVAMAQDLYCAVGIVTALIECPAAAFFIAFVGRITTPTAIAEHLDDDDRGPVVGVRLRRQCCLLGRRGGVRCGHQRGDRRALHRWNADRGALHLDVGDIEHLQRRDGEVARDADPRLTGIDGAARREQIDVARRNTGYADQGCDAGAGLRRGGRLGHLAVSVVENLRGAGHDRGLFALSGVDIAIGRPDHDVAAKLGEDTRLGDDDALVREHIDVSALQSEQARPGCIRLPCEVRCLVDETQRDAAARRQNINAAALLGADARVGAEAEACNLSSMMTDVETIRRR